MLENIALFRQVIILEKEIEKYKVGNSEVQTLISFTHLVHNGYYNGHSAIDATNSEMKSIVQRMRDCELKLESLLLKSSLDETAAKEMHTQLQWLTHACEEIERWSALGHWKEA